MKKQVDNIIFTTGSINIRTGGPSGYIANLKEGLQKNNISNIQIVSFENNVTFLDKLGLFFINS